MKGCIYVFYSKRRCEILLQGSTEIGQGYICNCANVVRAQNPNAAPSDVVGLIGNIYPFPSHEYDRTPTVSSKKNKK